MTDAIVIEDAARAGWLAYFGNRKPWPETPDWTPEKQTWLEFAACILNGNLTDARQAHAWYVDIREGKAWQDLAWNRKAIWTAMYRAIDAYSVQFERSAA